MGGSRFYLQGEDVFHEACHRLKFGKTCAGCAKSIDERYVSAMGRDWHAACLVCGGCRKPIEGRQFAYADMQAWHEACLVRAKSPRCAICARPMTGVYQRDPFGNRFCAEHQEKLVACLSCRRLICEPLTQGGGRNRDGHAFCNICSRTAVDVQSEASFLLDQTRRDLAQIGLNLGGERIPFRLVGQTELDTFNTRKRADQPTLGMARHQVLREGGEVVNRSFLEIIILRGLPREHFQTVAAHELCHAWLFFHGFQQLPEQVEEGLCTLCEYLWLARQKTNSARVRSLLLRKNPDPTYGEALRRALKAVERLPLSELMAHVKKHRKFPGLLRRMFA